jgi:Na+-transporting NADH:ubiquinone oxidoreductase subunit C
MSRDSVAGTFLVAAVLCIVCSVLVSTAAVQLRPLQQANKDRFQKKNILIAADMYDESKSIEDLFADIESQIIDLETGQIIADGVVDAATFDQRAAAKDPALSVEIPSEKDIAGIKRREKYAQVYLVKENGAVSKVILPIYGKGLWSTLYGFVAIEADLNTIGGLTFYEHRETPGLGGEVDNPRWKSQWAGKLLHDESGEIRIEVVKGRVIAGSPNESSQVDGLSGATITSRGVSNLVRYWISEDAFGPYLEQLDTSGKGETDG